MKATSLAALLKDLDDPTPRDFDPEDIDHYQHGDDGDSDQGADDELDRQDAFDGREHYVPVGKSKLRKNGGRGEAALGPAYRGTRVSRQALLAQEQDEGDYASQDDWEDKDEKDNDEDAREAKGEDGDISGTEDEEDGAHASGGAVDRLDIRMRNGNGAVEDDGHDDDDHFSGFSTSQHASATSSASERAGASTADEDTQSNEDDDDDDDGGDSDDDEEDEYDDAVGRVASRAMDASKRAQLRQMMGEEQRTVVKSIAEATRADADKGRAVRHQRKAYDSLLNTRIRLQKALVAMNSLPLAQNHAETSHEAYAAAEDVAMRLWTQLTSLRQQLHAAVLTMPGTVSASNHKHPKRKRDNDDDDAEHARDAGGLGGEGRGGGGGAVSEEAATKYRRTVLEKWSARVRGVTSQSLARKLNGSALQPSITDMLDEHLSNTERLVKRTRVPRSCAPLQAQAGVHESADVYDDADFYQLQLRELVDQRMLDPANPGGGGASVGIGGGGGGGSSGSAQAAGAAPWAAMREAKTKKKVDTRASKGRKLRYTVHEKLQNFMVAEDRSTWGKRQVDELFGSLLGARMRLNEEEEAEDDAAGNNISADGLLLFRR